MPLDHSEATMRITFDGLFLFCFTAGTPSVRECEIGAVNLPPVSRSERGAHPAAHHGDEPHHHDHKHEFGIEVTEPGAAGDPSFRTPAFRLQDEILIEASHPLRPGVHEHKSPAGKESDPEDFRWIADLGGKDFHDEQLNIHGKELLRPRFRIKHGLFYTYIKTVNKFDRIKAAPTPSPSAYPIGKIADLMSVDILCVDNEKSGIRISDSRHCLFLPMRETIGGVVRYNRYDVLIKNTRASASRPAPSSDFLLYYQVIRAGDGVQYDLALSTAGSSSSPSARSRDKDMLGAFPQVCDPAFLSRNDTLDP